LKWPPRLSAAREAIALQNTAITLAAAFVALALVPMTFAGPLPATPGVDSDGDGFADVLENVLGSNAYMASDTPAQVAPNGALNPGFEISGRPVAEAVTCPVFGDFSIPLPSSTTPLVILSPCYSSALNAAAWSIDGGAHRVLAMDTDGDGDREMRIPTGASVHNFWQSYASHQQVLSADIREVSFDIEVDGATAASIPGAARVQISVSLTPFNDLTTWVPYYVDCHLTLSSSVLKAHGTFTPYTGPGGKQYLHVSIDPAKAPLGAYWEGCVDEAAAYNAGTPEQRRAMLATMRILQTSFWAFNGLVLDNADLRGVKPAAGVPDGFDLGL
jgi:hypothetical protein